MILRFVLIYLFILMIISYASISRMILHLSSSLVLYCRTSVLFYILIWSYDQKYCHQSSFLIHYRILLMIHLIFSNLHSWSRAWLKYSLLIFQLYHNSLSSLLWIRLFIFSWYFSKIKYFLSNYIICFARTKFIIFYPRIEKFFEDHLSSLIYMCSRSYWCMIMIKYLITDNWLPIMRIMSFLSVSLFYCLLVIIQDVIHLHVFFFFFICRHEGKLLYSISSSVSYWAIFFFSWISNYSFKSISSLCRMIELVEIFLNN